ncbi:pentapeptide repeat-containing protein [Phormidium sp. LEGE 05292]|uniref:ion channel n=1 Tax=[Phormidium] sp. LEGE 05292 TaxID=767427 RepID=UPI00187FA670|nr:ion channel [Phormidium sp. LEGE 05292]MBE9227086.1 pentapeptide repeat-containing protein [Phormidium sp. LEGE 05292]
MQSQSAEITPEFFITPNQDLNKTSQEILTIVNLSKEQLRQRWNTPQGQYILSKWRGNKYDRKVLDSLVGKYYGHTDIRGIPLAREDLSKVDLSNVDLYSSNIEDAVFKFTNLSDSWLSESNMKGTCFDFAIMNNVLIDNVEFNKKTSFIGVNLNTMNFNLAALLQDYATTQQRIENLKTKHPLLAGFLWITCDYGRSFTRFFIWCLAVVIIFGLLYTLIPGSLSKPGFWNSLYFSTMAFTTLGSDIQAISPVGKILVVMEAAIGYLMTGLLVAILVRRTIGD